MEILIGILFGVFATHNIEKSHLYMCKVEKNPASCEAIAKMEK